MEESRKMSSLERILQSLFCRRAPNSNNKSTWTLMCPKTCQTSQMLSINMIITLEEESSSLVAWSLKLSQWIKKQQILQKWVAKLPPTIKESPLRRTPTTTSRYRIVRFHRQAQPTPCSRAVCRLLITIRRQAETHKALPLTQLATH